ncbi:NAD(P)/FAD-dependent oxidoreductase [Novosphingobium tardum]|uniref:NAD(P)/FAD-dependent oxidoreductase n=1 Tax=Novosphingobium tardum TaxID=1538021 RepID=A0ABV8RKE2_9SPHN
MPAHPALIVGGGPAGAAAAITLARAAMPHLLLERSRETGDALCGGFLSWRTLETLAGLGIAAADLNPVPTLRTRLFAGTSVAESPLPRPACSVSRHRLDTVLLAAAIGAGARVERGVAVREIGDSVRLDDGAELAADTVFLASGKHDVRGAARPAGARGSDPSLGLRVRIAAAPALAALVGDAVELHLFERGYVGVALQEDGSANLCMAVHRSRLQEAGSPEALLAQLAADHPALGERLAFRSGSEPIDAVANVPYGWHAAQGAPGLFRLGDQAGVIPSLAGEGMGIAIASGVSAAAAHAAGLGGQAWQERFARRIARPIGLADTIRSAAENPLGARALVATARALPASMGWAARMTRIAD